MTYKYISELPDSVKNHLPKHAQEIYMKSFNNAWNKYADSDKRIPGVSQQEAASKEAWEAVKHKYKKDSKGQWVEKQF